MNAANEAKMIWQEVFERIIRRIENAALYRRKFVCDDLTVLVRVEEHASERWRHVAVIGTGRMPTYEEMRGAKAVFVGAERDAAEYFAPESEHINREPFTRHLWSREDGRTLPDFRRFDPFVGELNI